MILKFQKEKHCVIRLGVGRTVAVQRLFNTGMDSISREPKTLGNIICLHESTPSVGQGKV